MSRLEEKLSEQFYKWEIRGRGWQVFREPVHPEPPFVPFRGHYLPDETVIDDGHRPTFLSSLVQTLSRKLSTAPVEPEPVIEEEEEPEPTILVRDPLIEFQASLPQKLETSREAFEHFLSSVSLCREPLAFEIVGSGKQVNVQFASHPDDALLLQRQLEAYFPEAIFLSSKGALEKAWEESPDNEVLAVEFGLASEFMLPLASGKLDPFIGIIGALSEFQPGELGLYQTLWQQVQHPWAESIVGSVSHADGKPFFVNYPEFSKAAEAKVSRPIYAAVVRILVRADNFDRVIQLARGLAASLRVFSHPNGNHLVPLRNDEYPFEDHIVDVLSRQSRRAGMVLNSDELIGFVHLPGSAVRSPVLARQAGITKTAPAIVRAPVGLLLGSNEHAGATAHVRLTTEQRVRHCHIIGASGTGKSTLLYDLIKQDIENGDGVAVLDPHGDLIDRILGEIPEFRIDDVVLVDPSDEEYSVGFNILSAHSELEKTLLASDLVAVFERLSTSWGDQMNSVLQNAILAFLESSRGGTIADLRRFLIEPPFRAEFLQSVQDSEVVYYWQKSFPHLVGNKSVGSILTRLDAFLSKKPIRYMVAQKENRLDFAEIMNGGKIFLAKLPEGLLGRENSYLLGTLLVSKFQQIAMSRQAQSAATRTHFWLYIDEFANFITPSMAEILSGARKYKIGLTLAHHELHQLDRDKEVASAVMTHPCTRIVFRVSDDDAKKLADGFVHFEAKDLRNLEVGQAVCRVERSDYDFNLAIRAPSEVDATIATSRREQIIRASREKYSKLRKEVENHLAGALKVKESEYSIKQNVESALKGGKSRPRREVAENAVDMAGGVSALKPDLNPAPADPSTRSVSIGAAPNPEIASPKDTPETETKSKPVVRELGRGGPEHRAIQRMIKEEGQKLGFLSIMEYRIPGSGAAVDVLLKRGENQIACEIPVSNKIEYEVWNVEKCIKAGFAKIAVISDDEEALRKIAEAVASTLGADANSRTTFYVPEQFIAFLRALPVPTPKPTEKKVKGYTVRHSPPRATATKQSQNEDIAYKTLVEVLCR